MKVLSETTAMFMLAHCWHIVGNQTKEEYSIIMPCPLHYLLDTIYKGSFKQIKAGNK
jgi:hypothetical protein